MGERETGIKPGRMRDKQLEREGGGGGSGRDRQG